MTLFYMNVRDEKATGTAGGSKAIGWDTRVLNTEVRNTIVGASLSSNQVLLPTGSYYIDALAPHNRAGLYRLSWYNVTDAADELLGTPHGSVSTGSNYGAEPRVRGRFTIASAKTFELRHYSSHARADFGQGFEISDGETEVYADVHIWKVLV